MMNCRPTAAVRPLGWADYCYFVPSGFTPYRYPCKNIPTAESCYSRNAQLLWTNALIQLFFFACHFKCFGSEK